MENWKCPNCTSKHFRIDSSKQLLSFPPQYHAECIECLEKIYITEQQYLNMMPQYEEEEEKRLYICPKCNSDSVTETGGYHEFWGLTCHECDHEFFGKQIIICLTCKKQRAEWESFINNEPDVNGGTAVFYCKDCDKKNYVIYPKSTFVIKDYGK